MKVAVMGAGAVGCYYGAMLAQAGHELVLIGRTPHVEAIGRTGLRLQTAATDVRLPVPATSDAGAVAGAQAVLFCVKSGDTERAAAAMAPALAPDALVLSLQNGIGNAEILRAVLPQTVAATVVYVAVEMAGPGHVRHHGGGELLIERVAAADVVAAVFASAGVPATLADEVRSAQWEKLIINCAYNALSAIARQPYGRLVAGVGVREVMQEVIAECCAVARAEGVAVAPDIVARAERIAATMREQFSSTAQDLARGQRSEIDHLNGAIVRRGAALGIATPVNRTLHALVRLLEVQ